MRYSVASSAANAADAGEAAVLLWNPAAAVALYVVSAEISHAGALASATIRFARITTAGAGGTTITPDADNARDRGATPPSGAILKVGNFTTNPTEATPPLMRIPFSVAASPLFSREFTHQRKGKPWTPLEVPAGTGLAFYTDVAGSFFSGGFAWEE